MYARTLITKGKQSVNQTFKKTDFQGPFKNHDFIPFLQVFHD